MEDRNNLIAFVIEARSSIEDIDKVQMLEELNIMSYENLVKEADFCEELLNK